MERVHAHLLGLLHEIDDICKKYNITYYAAGGTTIGAVRHNGFIPWDDDADLYMTRENFYKFRKAFYLENPQDRVLECLDDNPQCPATIPRYIETTTTTLCRFHCMNTCAGGLIIDIFILDPIPNDKKIQEEYLAKFNVYNDLVVPYYVFSQRNSSELLDLYDRYKNRVELEGREKVLNELEQELFSYSEEECACYVLRWGTLPSIFPKDMFGTPEYMKFEDMSLPVPHLWYDYLYQLYGADWMYIPSHEDATQHVSIVNMDIPYTEYTPEIDEHINKKEAAYNYQLRKELVIKRQQIRKNWNEKILQLNKQFVVFVQNKKILMAEENVTSLLQEKKFTDILSLFDCFLENQCSPDFLGKMRHSFWYRYRNPEYIDIGDENINAVLLALVSTDQLKKADNILKARKINGKELSKDLRKTSELIDNIHSIIKAYYSNNKKYALESIKLLSEDERSIIIIKRIECLLEAEFVNNERYDKVSAKIIDELEKYNNDIEILKAYGDLLYKQNYDKAYPIYQKVLKYSSNGILIKDIKNKFPDIKPFDGIMDCHDDNNKKISSFQKLQLDLLLEIKRICTKYNIKYFLHGDTARYAYYKKEFKEDYMINSILMTADNAVKFIKALEREKLHDRHIDSMITNSQHLSYDLYYTADSTLYFPIREANRFEHMGIFIRIRVLKQKDNRLLNKYVRCLEVLHEAFIQPLPDKRSNENYKVHKFGKAIMSVLGKRIRACISKKIFSLNTQLSLSSKSGTYYVTLRNRGLRHVDSFFEKRDLKQVKTAQLYGYDFPVLSFQVDNIDDNKLKTYGNKRGLMLFTDTGIDYNEFQENVDLYKITADDQNMYNESLYYSKKLNEVNNVLQRYWAIICRIDDKFKMQNKYAKDIKYIEELYQKKQYKKVIDCLREYDFLVDYYLEKRLVFSFDDKVFDIYCDCLSRLNKNQKLEAIESCL